MRKISSTVTIRDVAQLAGVSPATVSKVLNDAPHVSTDARSRVLDAVEKLQFRPNTIARSMKKGRTHTLGLITDDIEGVFTMSLMRGVEDAASKQGFSVFLCNSYGDMERERDHLDVLLSKQVDGIMLLSGYRVRARGVPALRLGNIPVVYLYQYTHEMAAPCVIPDDFGGGYIATQHLIERGRRRIAMLNGPVDYEVTRHRYDGYRLALSDAGLPFDPMLVHSGTWYEDSGYRHMRDLLALPTPPDALFCASDAIAIGALDALHEAGLSVPRDVALVGFDNRVPAAHQRPPLTTVALPLYEMGVLAGELLLAAVSNEDRASQIHKVPCYLIPRESS